MVALGDLLGGRYRLVELLGQGGMATIYRATDAQLHRDVAVKVLRPEYGRDPDFVARFRQEAQAAASLSHPNVVGVYDFGASADGPYIVMELVDGEDVATLLARHGPLPPRQAAQLTAEAARALAAAHARGIVHRDVKPGNILISSDGRVKVADFGIARAWADARLTLPGVTLGSVHYFSPEQALGEQATERSDIYSLGVVLYELLSGRRPWEGDSAAAIATARLNADPPFVSAVRPSVPPALEAIDRRALNPDPTARYPTATAMADALEAFLAESAARVPAAAAVDGAPGSAGTASVEGAAGTAASAAAATEARAYPADAYAVGAGRPVRSARTAPPPPGYDEPEERRGTSRWTWLAGLLGLVMLVVIGFAVFRLLQADGPAVTPGPGTVTLPSFVDQSLAAATSTAQQLGVFLEPAYVERTDREEGTVVGQDPSAGTEVERGSTVRVEVVAGRGVVAVPTLVGLPEADAIRALMAANLSLGLRSEDFDEAIPAGSVVSSAPAAGVEVRPGTQVDYVVSMGPRPTPSPTPTPAPTVVVANYVGLTVQQATVQAIDQGLEARFTPAGAPADWIVVDQRPAAGETVDFGSDLRLGVVAPAPTPPPPPPTPAPEPTPEPTPPPEATPPAP